MCPAAVPGDGGLLRRGLRWFARFAAVDPPGAGLVAEPERRSGAMAVGVVIGAAVAGLNIFDAKCLALGRACQIKSAQTRRAVGTRTWPPGRGPGCGAAGGITRGRHRGVKPAASRTRAVWPGQQLSSARLPAPAPLLAPTLARPCRRRRRVRAKKTGAEAQQQFRNLGGGG